MVRSSTHAERGTSTIGRPTCSQQWTNASLAADSNEVIAVWCVACHLIGVDCKVSAFSSLLQGETVELYSNEVFNCEWTVW